MRQPGFMTLLRLEFFKSRRQHLFLIEGGLFAFLLVYYVWCFRMTKDLSTGWLDAIYTVPLLDGMIFPLCIAAVASRLCEAEHKGGSFKLLETMQSPRSLFDAKLACGAVHMLLLCVAQTLLVVVLGLFYGYGPGGMPVLRLLNMTVLLFGVSMLVFVLQLGLSLLLANQLIPLSVGAAGSFLGFVMALFPQVYQRMLPWGYYCALMQVGMDYDSESRTATYYWSDFDWLGLALLGVWLVAVLALARAAFAKREV